MEHIVGSTGKKLVVRLLPGEKLVEGIVEAVQVAQLENAVITACIGSLKKVTYMYAVSDAASPQGFRYCDPIVVDGIIEFIAAQGFICPDDLGELTVHVHAVFGDETGAIKGGHLLPHGNEVLATMEVYLEEVAGVKMVRKLEKGNFAPVLTLGGPAGAR